ncbi:NfeD family protein [Desulfitobacterium metallireducens]|uniref:Membrane protein n=1 Tax=Desulfitobacterium metallireducens DSM 15288 TaxID=871968 RepID=W0ECN0_9FIRM|nr:NfeD family protein [Desulfitobacterium metallireducens]AHF06821.1 membrane protein [Desulfitobacterium metallireducens DSM 15288]
MEPGFVSTLFILGIILLFLEIFIPGGILGGLGIVLFSIGIFLIVDSALQAILYIGGMLLALGILILLSFRFPRTRKFWKKFSLGTRQMKEAGYVAPEPSYEHFLGKRGVALSQLRPAGVAEVEGERLDVVTEGGFISQGTKIKVIEVEGTRIIVREE